MEFKRNLTLLTDFYELTMMSGYLRNGMADKIAVFDLFFRENAESDFCIAAGLQQAIEYMPEANTYGADIEKIKTESVVGWGDLIENTFDVSQKDILAKTQCSINICVNKEGLLEISLVCNMIPVDKILHRQYPCWIGYDFEKILQNGVIKMLLEFRIQNYKSFLEETVFSMQAAPKQKGLDYSLFVKKHRGKTIKTLCSSVIYGHNAAGKTNIIGAMDTFRASVLRGNIRNAQDSNSPNAASSLLELIPNSGLTESHPVLFGVDFLSGEYRIAYALKLDLGRFLEKDYPRRVLEEKLTINGETVFVRTDGGETPLLQVNGHHALAGLFSSVAKHDHGTAEMLARDGLNR